MPDLDRRFRSLDLLEAPDVSDEIDRRSALPSNTLSQGVSHRVVAGVLAFALFAGAALFAWSVWRSRPEHAVLHTPSPPPPTDLFSGIGTGLTELPPPPRLLESGVSAWTGRELILWGGNERFGDPPHLNEGYAFDAVTLTWHALPRSPLTGRSWAAGVWTGHELVIWGGATGHSAEDGLVYDGAAYDPVAGTWRTISQPSIGPTPVIAAVWTGDEVVIIGGGSSAAYNPASDTWRPIPDPPVDLSTAHAVWTGDEVIVFGAFFTSDRFATSTAIGAAYNPATNVWREITPSKLLPNAQTAVWDGSRLVALDYGLSTAAFDPVANGWTALPPMPFNECEGYPEAAAADSLVMAQFCGEVGTLSPGDMRWHVVFGRDEPSYGFYAQPIAAGRTFLLVGRRFDSQRARMLAYVAPAQVPNDRKAWDVAAALAALRAGYPYEASNVPPDAMAALRTLVSPAAYASWQDPSSGLGKLWSYYTGFVVRSSERADAGYRVVVHFTTYSGNAYDEVLTVAPGTGLDGELHDLVVTDAAPAK